MRSPVRRRRPSHGEGRGRPTRHHDGTPAPDHAPHFRPRQAASRPTPTDTERCALAFAAHFADQVIAASARAIERHPDDCRAALRDALVVFLDGLRAERLAYGELLTSRWNHPGLRSRLEHARDDKRERLLELWACQYSRVNGLSRSQARGLSAFQYDGVRGLAAQVDSGAIAAEAAVSLFIDMLDGAAKRLGGALSQEPHVRSRR